MNKKAFITDLHLGARAGNVHLRDAMIKFLQEIVYPKLVEHGITTLRILGDFTDSRRSTDYMTIGVIKKEVFDWFSERDIELEILCGNHDIFYRHSNDIVSYETMIDSTNKVKCISTVQEIDGFLVIPWINSENFDEVMTAIEETDCKYALGHLEIAGAKMYKTSTSEHGISPDVFKKFDRVLTGHYHHRNEYGKCTYIGAAGYYTWQDCDDYRGMCILDTSTNHVEYIENPFTNFERYIYDEENFDEFLDADLSSLSNKYVELKIVAKEDINKYNTIVKMFRDASPIDLKIIDETILEKEIVVADAEVEIENNDVVGLLIKSFDDEDDKDELKELANDIHKEAVLL